MKKHLKVGDIVQYTTSFGNKNYVARIIEANKPYFLVKWENGNIGTTFFFNMPLLIIRPSKMAKKKLISWMFKYPALFV